LQNIHPKNFYELKTYYELSSELLSKDLVSFFISWKNRLQQKPLIIIKHFDNYDFVAIEKYKQLGLSKNLN